MINWGAANHPIYDNGGVGGDVLFRGCIVQLIWDQDLDGINSPGKDGNPGDGDILVGTSWIGHGSFFEGEFSQNTDSHVLSSGDIVYVRAWNDSILERATYYGDTRDHLNDTWVIDNDLSFTLDCTRSNTWATIYPVESGMGVDEDGLESGIQKSKIGFSQVYPNPFNQRTAIHFSINEASLVHLAIYDVTGRALRNLVDGKMQSGKYEIFWDGRDDRGEETGSGIYFSKLFLGDGKTFTKKIVFVKDSNSL
jgi:hypothetical protein